ncbi:FecR family protein [Chitinophaga sp. S165]|uniref:FecR family protein n=1 Tax=Chitinophaga sp. S165 TaxID=2135462 RepID=UPI000D7124FA|nr:FecR domain-containing protein [Chitinophaga sp. S165]PWV56256.1 FecR family protein [Chitinophaga sp. S165]
MKNRNLKTEALIIAEITGSITDEERAELEELMKSSSDVRVLSENMHKVLEPKMKEISEVRNTSAEKIIELGNARLHTRGRVRRMFTIAVSVAAACMVGAFFAVFYFSGRDNGTEALFGKGQNVWLDLDEKVIALSGQHGEINTDELFTYNGDKTISIAGAVGKTEAVKLIVPWDREYKIRLSDGTLVHMNSGSVLSWHPGFGNGKREVSLSGEAFFEVKENASQPFIIHLRNETVEVLGTSFNVRAYYNEKPLQISLITGSINVNGRQQSVHLKPGQEAVYINDQLRAQLSDTTAIMEWKRRMIDLPDAGVEDIEKAVARYYGEKVEFDDAIQGRRTAAVIDRDQPVEVFIERYAQANGLKYSKENGIYRLSLLH